MSRSKDIDGGDGVPNMLDEELDTYKEQIGYDPYRGTRLSTENPLKDIIRERQLIRPKECYMDEEVAPHVLRANIDSIKGQLDKVAIRVEVVHGSAGDELRALRGKIGSIEKTLVDLVGIDGKDGRVGRLEKSDEKQWVSMSEDKKRIFRITLYLVATASGGFSLGAGVMKLLGAF